MASPDVTIIKIMAHAEVRRARQSPNRSSQEAVAAHD